jgi:hypothetical protein
MGQDLWPIKKNHMNKHSSTRGSWPITICVQLPFFLRCKLVWKSAGVRCHGENSGLTERSARCLQHLGPQTFRLEKVWWMMMVWGNPHEFVILLYSYIFL